MKKNLLKKVLAMTVTVAMLGGLVACGSASNESSAEPAPASSEAAQTTAEEGAAGETADEAAQASDSGVIIPHFEDRVAWMWWPLLEGGKRMACVPIPSASILRTL